MTKNIVFRALCVGALVFGLSACGSETTSSAPNTSGAPATDVTSSTPDASQATGATNDRGNLEKRVGETAGTTAEVDGKEEPVLDFAITKITPDFTCTEKYAEPAENGHFLKIDVNAKTGSAQALKAAYQESGVSLMALQWEFIDANGTTVNNIATGPSFGCISQQQTFPSTLGAARKASGSMVFDVPASRGTLVAKDPLLGSGWEWKIGR